MTTLLITGSRDISGAGIKYAKAIVARAKELGWQIVVGDAPGVDWAVIDACDDLKVPVRVYGSFVLRRRSKTGQNITSNLSYLKRDELMAGKCDECVAIWNGASRGTRHTFETAQTLKKNVYVKEFPKSED